MFMSIGYILEYCGSQAEVTRMSFALFLILFDARLGIDEYSNRFFSDDVFHRVVYYIYTFGVFVMTYNVNYTYVDHRRRRLEETSEYAIGDCPYVYQYWDGVAYGFFITRVSLIMLYTLVCYNNKEALEQFASYVIRYTVSVVLIGISFNATRPYDYYPAVALTEVLLHVLPYFVKMINDVFPAFTIPYMQLKIVYPLDIYEYQSRLGVFYLMTLGESMIQILSRVYNTDVTERCYNLVS
jgi:hypothetical protein